MKSRFLYIIKRHLRDFAGTYFLLVLLFVAGIVIGFMTNQRLEQDATYEIQRYINGSMYLLYSGSPDFGLIFLQSFRNILQCFAIVLFAGLIWFLCPITLGMVLFRGFVVGFSFSFFIGNMGVAGFFIYLLAILPQQLIFTICLFVLSCRSLHENALSFRERKRMTIKRQFCTRFKPHTTFFLKIMLFSLFAMLIETFISPLIITMFYGVA